MKNKVEFAVIGNGAIGTLTAIRLLEKFPGSSISIIGPSGRIQGASAAAGAMANVYAEIEDLPQGLSAETNNQLLLGIEGSALWRRLLSGLEMEDCITASRTLLYLQAGASVFESNNFKLASEKAIQDGIGRQLNSSEWESAFPTKVESKLSVTELVGEFAIDTHLFFSKIDEWLRSQPGLSVIDGFARRVDPKSMEITLDDGEKIFCDRIIVANGAYASHVFEERTVIETLSGFGTAVEVRYDRALPEVFRDNVVRTANRGGSQCGLHAVPRTGNSIYLGAGNTVGVNAPAELRLETVRYLIDRFQREFVGQDWGYDSTGSIVLGARPKTLDGFPAIGPIGDGRVFVASGTNRAGLTWAPRIAEEIVSWCDGKPLSERFSDWDPERKPRFFGNEGEGLSYFVQSRLAAAFEHGLLEDQSQLLERQEALSEVGRRLLGQVRESNPALHTGDSVLHPDHWQLLTKPFPEKQSHRPVG